MVFVSPNKPASFSLWNPLSWSLWLWQLTKISNADLLLQAAPVHLKPISLLKSPIEAKPSPAWHEVKFHKQVIIVSWANVILDKCLQWVNNEMFEDSRSRVQCFSFNTSPEPDQGRAFLIKEPRLPDTLPLFVHQSPTMLSLWKGLGSVLFSSVNDSPIWGTSTQK